MNIYLPGPGTILRYTISCGVELASPALTALGEHVGDADNIAHTAYKAGGKPISTTFTALRQRRGSRPVALVCTAVERVASKFFYHKYHLIGRAKKTINTAIAVLETVEALCAHHLQEPDSVPPAESLTSSAILGTRPSAKVTLPPHAVALVVGTFHRLSTVFGGDFHARLANFLSRVSPRGFLLLKTALEDLYEWLIEKTREHVRFGRERFPLLPRTTFYLLTLSIAVLVFLLAVISAFPADGVVRRPPPEDGNIREDVDGHDYGHSCDCGGYPGEGASNTASAEGGYDGEDEDHSSVGGEDASSQYSNSDGSLTVEKVGIDLDGGSDTEVELEKKQALENPGIVPERVEIVLKMAMDSETTTESDEFMSDFADEDKAVESTTVVGGFRGFEVDDSLVCNFEQTGSHGAANAAPLTSTQFLQIREEKELSSVASMAQAAPSTPMSYPTVAKHKRREIKVKRSPKIFRFPGPARKKVGVAPTKKKFSRRSLSTLRTISTTASSATLSRLNRISANQTISIAPPSSVSIFVPQRTRAKSFQDFMKNW